MESGIENWKDVFQLVIQAIGVGTIAYAVMSYKVSRKQQHFAVVHKCIERYQTHFAGSKFFSEVKTLKYIDLVNEELFYMKNEYLPFIVSVEWIDGILDILPIMKNREQIFTNPNSPIRKPLSDEMLKLYPRIRHAFTIKQNFPENIDLTEPYNLALRKNVIEEIMSNLLSEQRNIKQKTRKALIKKYHDF